MSCLWYGLSISGRFSAILASFSSTIALSIYRVLDKKHSGHNVKPASRAQRLDENYCPMEKDSSKKSAALWRKNLPKQLKNEKCWKIVTEESKRLLPKTTLPANDAVFVITEIILLAVVRWKSESQHFSVAN